MPDIDGNPSVRMQPFVDIYSRGFVRLNVSNVFKSGTIALGHGKNTQ